MKWVLAGNDHCGTQRYARCGGSSGIVDYEKKTVWTSSIKEATHFDTPSDALLFLQRRAAARALKIFKQTGKDRYLEGTGVKNPYVMIGNTPMLVPYREEK